MFVEVISANKLFALWAWGYLSVIREIHSEKVDSFSSGRYPLVQLDDVGGARAHESLLLIQKRAISE